MLTKAREACKRAIGYLEFRDGKLKMQRAKKGDVKFRFKNWIFEASHDKARKETKK